MKKTKLRVPSAAGSCHQTVPVRINVLGSGFFEHEHETDWRRGTPRANRHGRPEVAIPSEVSLTRESTSSREDNVLRVCGTKKQADVTAANRGASFRCKWRGEWYLMLEDRVGVWACHRVFFS